MLRIIYMRRRLVASIMASAMASARFNASSCSILDLMFNSPFMISGFSFRVDISSLVINAARFTRSTILGFLLANKSFSGPYADLTSNHHCIFHIIVEFVEGLVRRLIVYPMLVKYDIIVSILSMYGLERLSLLRGWPLHALK